MHEGSQTGTGSFREDMTETWIRGLTHRRLRGGDSMILKGDWSVEFILSLLYFPEKAAATHSSVLAWRIPMDRGSWQATVHRITNSRTGLKRLSMHTHILSQVGERNTKNQERGWEQTYRQWTQHHTSWFRQAKGKSASPVVQPIVIDAKIRTESFSIIFIQLYLFANTPYHW